MEKLMHARMVGLVISMSLILAGNAAANPSSGESIQKLAKQLKAAINESPLSGAEKAQAAQYLKEISALGRTLRKSPEDEPKFYPLPKPSKPFVDHSKDGIVG